MNPFLYRVCSLYVHFCCKGAVSVRTLTHWDLEFVRCTCVVRSNQQVCYNQGCTVLRADLPQVQRDSHVSTIRHIHRVLAARRACPPSWWVVRVQPASHFKCSHIHSSFTLLGALCLFLLLFVAGWFAGLGCWLFWGMEWAWLPTRVEPAPPLPGSMLGLAACPFFGVFSCTRCNSPSALVAHACHNKLAR